MTPTELLKKITMKLSGMAVDDMTPTEAQITKLLVDNGYMTFNKGDERGSEAISSYLRYGKVKVS